ncbi:MAG: hypothetical protein ACREXP_23490 [Steroidobacteraceae bacterium]
MTVGALPAAWPAITIEAARIPGLRERSSDVRRVRVRVRGHYARARGRRDLDDEGFESAGASSSAWGTQSRTVSLTAPRTYGLEVQFRFGN